MNQSSRWSFVALAAILASGLARAQNTDRVSVATGGAEGNGTASIAATSADGRFVVFESFASNLVANDTNASKDIFVHDNQTGTTERVSVTSAGVEADNESNDPCITPDGRFVAFYSYATNLDPADLNGVWDVFVHDRLSGTTERVSVDSSGIEGNAHSRYPSISADGRYVAFASLATNLVVGDVNGYYDIFLRDRQNGTTELVSIDSNGVQGNQQAGFPAISADGRCVAFESVASNMVAGDTNGVRDCFVRDLVAGTTERVSVDSAGVQANAVSQTLSISANGRFVSFHTTATNLVASDTNGFSDVFVRDRLSGTTERASVDSAGVQANQQSLNATLSADGRFVAFESVASNLVAGDANGFRDIFVRDRQGGTTRLMSVDSNGVQSNALSSFPSISGDGRYVSFQSAATNLVSGDNNAVNDIFEHDGGSVSPGSDLCQPGTGGTIACPCGNPPANAPRGCDNSAGTGGAQLVSSGTASLSADTLHFVTNGEKPVATSIVLQGTLEAVGGIAFGQGVRCVGGALKRLYVKTASGGSISAPGPGDLSVSARAAQLNQPIPAGASRWYAVYYRDPGVLGGCGAANTFNITQTQLVIWGS